MRKRFGFTLIELLVVVAIIAVLVSILVPSLKAAKDQAKAVVCASNQRAIGQYSLMFATDHGYLPFWSWINGRWTFVSMLMGSEEGEMGLVIPWSPTVPYDLCPDVYNKTNYLGNPGAFQVFNCPSQELIALGGPDPTPEGLRVMWDQNLTYGMNGQLNGSNWGDRADKDTSNAKLGRWKNHGSNAFVACSDKHYAYIDGDWRSFWDPNDWAASMGGYHPKESANFLYMDGHVDRHVPPVVGWDYDLLEEIGWLPWK